MATMATMASSSDADAGASADPDAARRAALWANSLVDDGADDGADGADGEDGPGEE